MRPWDRLGRRGWLWLALVLWLVPFAVITVRVAARPEKRTVTPLYHAAVERWQARQPLYDGPSGMNYLPTFVPLFAPYHALPLRVADVLWRTTAMAGLAFGLWAFARRASSQLPERAFTMATLLALPLCLGALSNGQANAHLGATLLLAAWALDTERWWTAALLLALTVAIKPLGLAAAGLAFFAFPRLWWRLGLAVLLVFALPFLLAPAAYAQGQFHEALVNLRQCSEVTEHRFADLNGLLRTFGLPLAGNASLALRGLAGAALALLCLAVVRKRDLDRRALGWLAFAVAYLMLFNPMNEANSYVMFAPAAVLWLGFFLHTNRPRLAWIVAAMLLSMGLLPNLLRPWLGNAFALAWHPAMTLVFLALAIREFFIPLPPASESQPGSRAQPA